MKLYKITVTNFAKHNSHVKKSYKATLISNNFCDDAKLRVLPLTTRWLFLNLILTCSDHCRDTVELSSNQLRNMLECNRNIGGALDSLQSLQLVTYEVLEFSLSKENRNEEKRIERKGKQAVEAAPSPPPEKIQPELSESLSPEPVKPQPGPRELIAHYCDCWKVSYRSEKSPPISGRDAKTFSSLIKDFGFERAKILVTAYLRMPEQWFLKKRHDITTLTTNLNAVALFADSGKMISNQELKDLDKSLNQRNLIDAIERGEV